MSGGQCSYALCSLRCASEWLSVSSGLHVPLCLCEQHTLCVCLQELCTCHCWDGSQHVCASLQTQLERSSVVRLIAVHNQHSSLHSCLHPMESTLWRGLHCRLVHVVCGSTCCMRYAFSLIRTPQRVFVCVCEMNAQQAHKSFRRRGLGLGAQRALHTVVQSCRNRVSHC